MWTSRRRWCVALRSPSALSNAILQSWKNTVAPLCSLGPLIRSRHMCTTASYSFPLTWMRRRSRASRSVCTQSRSVLGMHQVSNNEATRLHRGTLQGRALTERAIDIFYAHDLITFRVGCGLRWQQRRARSSATTVDHTEPLHASKQRLRGKHPNRMHKR